MLLTRSSVYAIEVLIRLSRSHERIKAPDLRRAIGLNHRYLEPLLQDLGKAGLVCGVRGPDGGYRLNRPLWQISVGDVVRAAEATEERTNRHRRTPLMRRPSLWPKLQADIIAAFDRMPISLYADLVDSPEERKRAS